MDVAKPAPAPPPQAAPPTRESFLSRFFRVIRNLLLLILFLLALLWNWDGFWQTEIGLLRDAQQRYLPAKHAQEQQKLANVTLYNSELERLRAQLQALESQIAELKAAGDAVQKQRVYLEAALRMVANLSSKLPAEQLEALRGACTSLECEEIFSKGLAVLE